MELRVIGCHGGETPKHRTSAFVVADVLTVDAGSLTSGLTTADQARLTTCLISHAHLDHVRDLPPEIELLLDDRGSSLSDGTKEPDVLAL